MNEIDGSAMWCGLHWAPYGPGGLNGVAATAMLMQRTMDTVAERSLRDWGDTSPAHIGAAMKTLAPLCCLPTEAVMEAIRILAAEMTPEGGWPGLQGYELVKAQTAAHQQWQLERRQDVN